MIRFHPPGKSGLSGDRMDVDTPCQSPASTIEVALPCLLSLPHGPDLISLSGRKSLLRGQGKREFFPLSFFLLSFLFFSAPTLSVLLS